MSASKFPFPYNIAAICLAVLFLFSIRVGAQVGKLPTMGGVLTYMQRKMMGVDEDFEFPDTLEGFGYYFNSDGELRTIDTNEPFQFNAQEGNHHYNQKRYNAIGDIITEHLYQIMEKDYKLQRTYLPLDATAGEPRSFVFHSGDLYTSDKLMILIHGSGAVRAGQWARRLIINDNLDSGTQFPYIKWARDNNFSVLVANTNINVVEPDPKKKRNAQQKIRGNSSPEEHTDTIWRDFIQRCPAKHIAIVAHSYGGVCVLELVKKYLREFEERVFAVALTDSVHGMKQQDADQEVIGLYKKIAVNWASAYDELDEPLITSKDEVPTVSAGTDRHESTSYTSMNSIFKYIKRRYDEKLDPTMEKFVVPKRKPQPEDNKPVDRKKYWAKKEEEKKAKEAAKEKAKLEQAKAEQEEKAGKIEQGEEEGKTAQVELEHVPTEQADADLIKLEQSENDDSNVVSNQASEGKTESETVEQSEKNKDMREAGDGAQKQDENEDDDVPLIDLSSMKKEL